MVYYGDNAPQLAGSVITLAIITYVTFGLRVYTRIRIGAFGMDDWSMTAAAAPLTALCIGGAYNGIGIHLAKLNTEQMKTGM
ncbi:uncharacterized protein M421DRAFT_7669 [Didymella exigua CBS 183.55]|uniref:Uncharacterized protein n=1 Tax=Didymella exigua CBS 183.55 TaxID=1150837 RepID=A0A6A5RD60_9PLEO|nr:uncharacterized protein M421DRAFT_7669 [Didymella exigua CBS 183.55]KAF1925642.1 hypothetical protein M421DRAFT_7669 [Didymella exigua CBS 183.55]